jgi:hypothetical protein
MSMTYDKPSVFNPSMSITQHTDVSGLGFQTHTTSINHRSIEASIESSQQS